MTMPDIHDPEIVQQVERLPREVWVIRCVVAKGVEFVLSLPVLVGFILFYLVRGRVELDWELVFFPLAIVSHSFRRPTSDELRSAKMEPAWRSCPCRTDPAQVPRVLGASIVSSDLTTCPSTPNCRWTALQQRPAGERSLAEIRTAIA